MDMTEPDPIRRQLLGAAAATALWTAAPPARAEEPGVSDTALVIGQSITLQGGKNLYGKDVQAGVKALLDHVNRSGGVAGRQIVLRTLDDDNNPAQAEANARQLVQQGAFILFGSIEGGPSTAVMTAAVALGVPFFGPMAGSPGLRRPHQALVFPVRAEHRDEFRALIQQGQRIGLKRVALMHADSAVGREHLANVEILAAQQQIGFGGGLPFKSDITDAQLDGLAASLKTKGIDLVINHGSPGIYERMIRRARAAGLRTAFWAVNSGSSPLAAALGPLAEGMVFTQIVPNPRVGKSALVREYQERMAQSQPGGTLSYGSLEGFMTAKALVAALRAAGPTPTRASLLAALQNFDADLGGIPLRYRKGEHIGCSFVDLALVNAQGRFIQ